MTEQHQTVATISEQPALPAGTAPAAQIAPAGRAAWSTLDMMYIALFAVLISICAWISVPVLIPFTLQTLAIFLSAGLLGPGRATMAVLIYLLLGAVGVPVFHNFTAGLGILLGPTGGYLLGFLLAAPVIGLVCRRFGRSLPVLLLAMVLGMVVFYSFGTAWFMVLYLQNTGPISLAAALSMCVLPFILPDLAKAVVAAILVRRLSPYVKEPQRRNKRPAAAAAK